MSRSFLVDEMLWDDYALLIEQPLGRALKGILWRVFAPLAIVTFSTFWLWLIQLISSGLAAFSSSLFLLLLVALIVLVSLGTLAVRTEPDSRVVKAVGLSGWLRLRFFVARINLVSLPRVLLHSISKRIPPGATLLRLLEVSLVLDIRLFRLVIGFLGIWHRVLEKDSLQRPAAVEAKAELDIFMHDIHKSEIDALVLLQHLRSVRQGTSRNDVAAIRQILHATERLYSAFLGPLLRFGAG